ncbi:hypothetical protein F5Y16DRAFT_384946 [Xylariaceae sp. FL0255]|nr:hypothetical protein F5Y16DRAFT_384946 [Xylariaceae sp. FL0255]
MVVRTPPLSSLKKGFLQHLHQPLPLTRRESQQLLESITTSFRKNLDQEHPWPSADEPSVASAVAATSPVTEPKSTAPNCRPTDNHVRTILTNPLFAHPPPARAMRSPFDIFDLAESRGLMTTRRAAGFLQAVRVQLVAECPDDLRRSMAASEAGFRVIRWLRSSGLTNNLQFLSDHTLVRSIIPFLYAEGLHDIAWTWLAQLAARASEAEFAAASPGKANDQTFSYLMSVIINENNESSLQTNASLDSSFAALTKAKGLVSMDKPVLKAAFKDAWTDLSWTSTVKASERPKPSTSLFEAFVDIGRPLDLPLDLAHLDLHHPTRPTHSAAMEYLRLTEQIVSDISRMAPQTQRRILCLALDAAGRLKEVGETAEASWVERLRANIYKNLAF